MTRGKDMQKRRGESVMKGAWDRRTFLVRNLAIVTILVKVLLSGCTAEDIESFIASPESQSIRNSTATGNNSVTPAAPPADLAHCARLLLSDLDRLSPPDATGPAADFLPTTASATSDSDSCSDINRRPAHFGSLPSDRTRLFLLVGELPVDPKLRESLLRLVNLLLIMAKHQQYPGPSSHQPPHHHHHHHLEELGLACQPPIASDHAGNPSAPVDSMSISSPSSPGANENVSASEDNNEELTFDLDSALADAEAAGDVNASSVAHPSSFAISGNSSENRVENSSSLDDFLVQDFFDHEGEYLRLENLTKDTTDGGGSSGSKNESVRTNEDTMYRELLEDFGLVPAVDWELGDAEVEANGTAMTTGNDNGTEVIDRPKDDEPAIDGFFESRTTISSSLFYASDYPLSPPSNDSVTTEELPSRDEVDAVVAKGSEEAPGLNWTGAKSPGGNSGDSGDTQATILPTAILNPGVIAPAQKTKPKDREQEVEAKMPADITNPGTGGPDSPSTSATTTMTEVQVGDSTTPEFQTADFESGGRMTGIPLGIDLPRGDEGYSTTAAMMKMENASAAPDEPDTTSDSPMTGYVVDWETTTTITTLDLEKENRTGTTTQGTVDPVVLGKRNQDRLLATSNQRLLGTGTSRRILSVLGDPGRIKRDQGLKEMLEIREDAPGEYKAPADGADLVVAESRKVGQPAALTWSKLPVTRSFFMNHASGGDINGGKTLSRVDGAEWTKSIKEFFYGKNNKGTRKDDDKNRRR